MRRLYHWKPLHLRRIPLFRPPKGPECNLTNLIYAFTPLRAALILLISAVSVVQVEGGWPTATEALAICHRGIWCRLVLTIEPSWGRPLPQRNLVHEATGVRPHRTPPSHPASVLINFICQKVFVLLSHVFSVHRLPTSGRSALFWLMLDLRRRSLQRARGEVCFPSLSYANEKRAPFVSRTSLRK